jgi:uncharacterized repeat protein (TIGR01451 family)
MSSLPSRIARYFTLLLTSLLFAAWAEATPPPAGTILSNTATGSFVDTATGIHVRLTSNTVSTTVQPLEALLLTSNQTAGRSPGSNFTLPHQLTNTGNVASTYALTLTTVNNSFTPTGLQIVVDSNGNGVADLGEPVIANGGTVNAAAGGLINLLVVGTVPGSATIGQSAQFRITATSQLQSVSANNLDTVNVVNGAAISVTKSSSIATPTQGAPLSYSLTATNSGTAAAGPVAITVNGTAASLVILRDAIPANTRFASLSSPTPSVQYLFHRLGDPVGSYLTAQPANVDAIAWGLATLAPSASLVGNFTVTVNLNAAGTLANTGFLDYLDQGANFTVASNPVQLNLPTQLPSVTFYSSNSYTTPVQQSALGVPLFVQISAAQCNTNPAQIVTHPITLVSQLTGDSETFTATETAPNSGMFRILPDVPTADAAVHVVSSGDGLLELLRNDHVTATLSGCGSAQAQSILLIDPSGVVFNSKTNAPISGTVVQLIDVTGQGNGGKAGSPAQVLAADGITPAPSSVTTAVDGSYSFPLVAPSSYKLVVAPPNGYAFPSKLPIGLMPAGRNVTQTGSYGGNFSLVGKQGPITIDVPLDTGAATGLFAQKTASKAIAEVGDFVDYSITVDNNTGLSMTGLVINDQLPAGFAYVKGSARLNSARLPDPVGGAGPTLQFSLGTIAPSLQPLLTYRVRIGPGAERGTGINTAQAVSALTHSNIASVQVKVSGGVFSDKAYVFGKVFAACDSGRMADADNPGIPGVRIYLDNGTFAITDEQGKYSLYGLSPRTYVAKVDTTTLPQGASFKVLTNRNARDGASQFIDLQNGEFHKADFAINECSDAIKDQIAARRKAARTQDLEITRLGATQVNANNTAVSDPRTLPASGIMGQRQGTSNGPLAATPTKTPAVAGAATTTPTPAADASSTPASSTTGGAAARKIAPREDLEQLLTSISQDAGFVDLIDGEVIPTDQLRVRVKGPLGTQLRLTVNGKLQPLTQVGQQSSLEIRGVTAWEYIGVNLQPGQNLLQVNSVDAFGNGRGTATIHLIAPGKLARIQITTEKETKADAQLPIDVTVRLLDENGVPVTSRTPVTLNSTLGEWQVRDLDPKEPGTQVFIEDGVGHFNLSPPSIPGRSQLAVSSGMVRAETEINFMPNLRPLIAAGIVEGAISLSNLNTKALTPTSSGDAFENEIRNVSIHFDSGKNSAAARTSLFLKGKILGSDLLTLAYDSNKPSDTALFRDIQPDQFYPVYGDSSVKGYDAQSTGKLYVRIDHGTSFVLYGDYTTQTDNPARLLGQYSRTLNGAKTHWEDGKLTVDGFTSYTDTTQAIDEIPANGTSGPYFLSHRAAAINSAQVEIISRDRNQPTLVLATTALSQFSDYVIESYTGELLMKAPVPSLDANLNPIYIRITYEVASGGAHYWVGGLDVREKVTDDVTLGGLYVLDRNPADHQDLRGANLLWKPNAGTTLVGEFVQSQSDLTGAGNAKRVELKHNDSDLQARLYAVQTDPTFNNPSSTYTAGADEYGAKIGYTIDKKDRLLVEALKSTTANSGIITPPSVPLLGVPASVTNPTGVGLSPATGPGALREGESVAIERSLPKGMKLTAGLRHVEANELATTPVVPGSASDRFTSARVRLDAPVPNLPKASAFAQYEKALDNSDREAATIGGTYQVAPQTKIYATHETSNSLNGDYGLNPSQQNYSSVLGIQTDYVKDGQLFNEYRVGDSIDGRSAEAALGLRNLWHLTPGLAMSTSVQQIHPIFGVVSDEASALTAAVAYTGSSIWKGSSRLEWSKSASSQTWLATAGGAAKLNDDFTILGREVYNRQLETTAAGGAIRLDQVLIGLAYRPVSSDLWNALARVEFKHSENGTLGLGLNTDDSAKIFSANVNFQPTADWVLSGRYGIKWAADLANGFDTHYTAQLFGGRSVWDISSQWDIGAQYFVEVGHDAAAQRLQAVGAEVGYLVMKNMWLSLGYNALGFRDPDLAGEDYTQRGFYLRLRVKFDENLFKPSNNSDALPADALRGATLPAAGNANGAPK